MALELEARLDNILYTAQREMADVDLFAPKEREECPICMIPLPLNDKEITFMSCCGCIYKNMMNGAKNGTPQHEVEKCSFCRQPAAINTIKALKTLMKRENSSQAFMQMASRHNRGEDVIRSDTKALEMYIRAAELGHAEAYNQIGINYKYGKVVEVNLSKALEYQEVSAKKGSILAHQNIAAFHGDNGNIDECIKHLKLAASAGFKDAMKDLMKTYKDKLVSKEDLAQTLRSYQASSDEMKSKDRDDARALMG